VKLSTRFIARAGLVATFVVLTACISTLVLVPRHSKPVAVADVGTVAPEFELLDSNGQRFSLADTRGQVVVLFFAALNDPRIAQQYERLDRLAREYADDGRIKILGINITRDDSAIAMANRSFDTLLDSHAAIAARYAATQTPLTVIIDAHGVVRYRGPMDAIATDFAPTPNSFVAEAIKTMIENATFASAK
jgi:peroxiredoxin